MYCVVGLGNPGKEYVGTRHNIGFAVVDAIADDLDTRIRRRVYSALTATGRIGRSEVLIMKPQTYMNLSGRSVRAAIRDQALPLEHVVVVHDEVDLPLGRIRVRMGGGSAGHNGIRSIVAECGSPEFVRVRVGVGRPPGRQETADYVLERFAKGEAEEVEAMTRRAADAVRSVIVEGVEHAMAKHNAATPA